MRDTSSRRLIAIVVYPGVQSLDVTGPLEVFTGAQQLIERVLARERGYDVRMLSRDGQPLQSSSGLGLIPHASSRARPPPIDTLIVAGGSGQAQACEDRRLLDWIARASRGPDAPHPCAPARSCSPAPGCSTAAARRRTGRPRPSWRVCTPT